MSLSPAPARLLALLLLASPFFLPALPEPAQRVAAGASPVSVWARLLGPAAPLAADLAWIGFQRARSEGRTALAIARAERALQLDPRRSSGWELLATHLGLTLASPEREPDPELRLAWLRAGLDAARRGAEATGDPGLRLTAGLLLVVHAEQDPGLPWPGGRAALWSAAGEELELAAASGVEGAGEIARAARRRSLEPVR